jgi:hypothetical protein
LRKLGLQRKYNKLVHLNLCNRYVGRFLEKTREVTVVKTGIWVDPNYGSAIRLSNKKLIEGYDSAAES